MIPFFEFEYSELSLNSCSFFTDEAKIILNEYVTDCSFTNTKSTVAAKELNLNLIITSISNIKRLKLDLKIFYDDWETELYSSKNSGYLSKLESLTICSNSVISYPLLRRSLWSYIIHRKIVVKLSNGSSNETFFKSVNLVNGKFAHSFWFLEALKSRLNSISLCQKYCKFWYSFLSSME